MEHKRLAGPLVKDVLAVGVLGVDVVGIIVEGSVVYKVLLAVLQEHVSLESGEPAEF